MKSMRELLCVCVMLMAASGCVPEPLAPPEDMSAAPDMAEERPDSGDAPCVMGERECVDGASARTCVSAETGGTIWSQADVCGSGVCVGAGECCEETCRPGERICTEAGVQTCEQPEGQCPRLSAPAPCPTNQACDATGQCVAGCRSECQAGEKLCFPEGSPAYRECVEVAGQAGCFKYEANERMCEPNALCTQGACVSQCNHGCPTAGAKQCSGGQEQECRADAMGCRSWVGTGGRCCNSATLGRDVVQGTCVQVNYAACSKPKCDWATCSNGTWNYCANVGACPADARFGHAACQ